MSHFIMLITYSFDLDYVAVPCANESDTIKALDSWLNEEIRVIKEESGYNPTVVAFSDTEKVLVYSDEADIAADNYYEHDYAMYKVIEAGHNCR